MRVKVEIEYLDDSSEYVVRMQQLTGDERYTEYVATGTDEVGEFIEDTLNEWGD